MGRGLADIVSGLVKWVKGLSQGTAGHRPCVGFPGPSFSAKPGVGVAVLASAGASAAAKGEVYVCF